jgi:class 3 adenylate cyclase/tetratricopeptide (TPR) repeat protein
VICPRCGKENGDDARFCNDCAAPLTDAANSSGEERKIVSILFCDLVGFTAASEDADPEDVRARIRPYHASLRHELERYGGTVEKFIGDAVMAVFGAPVAHEDDPERAVRAGLRIIEAIAELNEREPDLDLQVRVGINTGPAVVSLQARPERGEGFVAGDVVNTAARIQAAAPVNEVAVSQETFRQTERVITYEPLAEVDAKGKSAPVRLYRAIEARARFGADLIRTQETLFVGREVEKTLLQGLFDRCARDSTVELVTLVGEPGVGKSRLCAELYRYTDERPALIRWRQGRCLPYGEGITFWALGELVKSHAGIFESDSPDAAMTKLDEALPEVEERDWLRARLLPLLGIDSGGSESREESFAAWRRFVESIASDGPAVVVVEDLHWADPPLLDFLSYFSEWAGGVPLLLVCTARPELFEKHGSWGARTRNAHTINLSPLSENETSELVQGLLEQSVSEQVRQTILERAGGNPLYAEEFVRLVADRGLADTSEGVAFPDSVQALIAARLDTLSPDRKGLLQDAAVVGKVFWSGALAAMGGLDEREVELALHELSRRELVRPARRTTMERESEYAFWHVLLRDVAYGQIPRAARARKHRAAAVWMEEKAGERVEDLADVLAHHYAEALDLARAAGDAQLVDELLPAARRMLELAGDRAASLDLAKAESFYRRAVALHDRDSVAQAPLLLKAARNVVGISVAQADEDATRSADLFLKAGDELGAAEALLDVSRFATYRGSDAEEQEHLERARRLLERHPPGRVFALYLGRRAGGEMMAGKAAECVASSDAAIAMAKEFGLDDLVAKTLQYRGVARTELGDPGGLDDLRESLELLKGESAVATGICHLNLADATWMSVGAEEGLDLHRATQAFAESRGLRGSFWWSRSESTWMLFDLGRWDDLLATVDEVAAASGELGGLQAVELGLPYQALVMARRGDLLRAASIAEDVLPKARASADLQLLVPALAAGALVAATSDRDSALALARELDDATRDCSDRHRALFLAELTRMCVLADELDLARELGDGLTVELGRIGNARASAAATLAEAEGRFDDALALYDEALRRWRAFGGFPGLADALLGKGRCLVARGDAGAATPLREAHELFARMGDLAGVAESEQLLG